MFRLTSFKQRTVSSRSTCSRDASYLILEVINSAFQVFDHLVMLWFKVNATAEKDFTLSKEFDAEAMEEEIVDSRKSVVSSGSSSI
jgi:hypothetical protein